MHSKFDISSDDCIIVIMIYGGYFKIVFLDRSSNLFLVGKKRIHFVYWGGFLYRFPKPIIINL